MILNDANAKLTAIELKYVFAKKKKNFSPQPFFRSVDAKNKWKICFFCRKKQLKNTFYFFFLEISSKKRI